MEGRQATGGGHGERFHGRGGPRATVRTLGRLAAALTCCLFVLGGRAAEPALGWNRAGHYATALIAWRLLGPGETRKRLSELLERHPHRSLFLDDDRPSGVDPDEWRFVRAAQWPDWVGRAAGPRISAEDAARIRKEHHRSSWHYVNLPIVHPDDAGRFSEQKLRESVLSPALDERGEPRHLLAALERVSREYRDESLDGARRAVALSWVLHLTADLHQPLHSCTLLASEKTAPPDGFLPPGGDRGGNRSVVRTQFGAAKPQPLHAVWDGHYLSDADYAEVRDQVARWLAEPKPAADGAPRPDEPSALVWAQESYELAKRYAYRDGPRWLAAAPLPLDADKRAADDLDAPAVSPAYLRQVELVSQRQLHLAGRRLARSLEPAAASVPAR